MSRETDTPSSGPDGRGGAAYPSGTPPYGTPAASDDRTDAGRSAAQPEERKTETTLTTRIRINIPGSRPIPPVVVRTPVADSGSGDGSTTAETQLPSSALPTGVVEPTAELALPGAEEKTSDWFAPRKSGPAKGGQSGGGTNGAGIPGGSAAGAPSAPASGAPAGNRPGGARPGGVVGGMSVTGTTRQPGAGGGTNGAGIGGATGAGPVAPGHGGGTGSFDVTEALAAGPRGPNGSRPNGASGPNGGPGEPRRDDLPYFSENGQQGGFPGPAGPGAPGGYPEPNGQGELGGYPGSPNGQGELGGFPGSNGQDELGGFPGSGGPGPRAEQFPGPGGQGMGPGGPGGPGGPSGFNGPNGRGGQGGPEGPAGPTAGPVTGNGLMLPPGPMGGAQGAPSGYADGPGGPNGAGGPAGLAGPGGPGVPGAPGASSGRHGGRGRPGNPGGPGGPGGPGAGPGGPGGPGMGPGGPGTGPGGPGGASLPGGMIPGGGLSDDTAILTPQKPAPGPGGQGYGAPADQVSGHTVTSGMPVVPGAGTSPFGTGTHPDGPLPHTPPKTPEPGSAQSAPAGKKAGKGAKKKKKGRSKSALLLVGVFVIAGGVYGAGLLMNHTDVPKGTTVLGVDIGGSTRDDAVKKLDDAFGDRVDKPLKLSVGGKTVSLKPDQAGLQFDTAATVSAAATSDYNPVSVIGSLFGQHRVVDPVMPVDEEKLTAALSDLGGGSGSGAVTEGTIQFTSGKAVAVYGKAGKAIDASASVDAVEKAYRSEVETGTAATVTVPTTTKQPTITNAEVDREMKAFAEPAMSDLVKVKTDTGITLPLSPKNSLWKFLRVKAVNGKLTDSPDLAALKALYGSTFDGVTITRAGGQKTAVTPQEVYIALRQALISKTDRVGIIDTTPN
ncbi:hypothetical protein JHN63_30300 [Streptomyces sp. MBT65]|uniref:hypothetical protein n=1 Tax=Streptomyces sp. MBT65 TaxID=1488395 RepID=UPI0019098916|nr:hypothetical protein [Streptomyces sp. MBT65]MBK3578016.1 hypothetical protein [Streptomyces sp. MBT65]